MNPLYGVPLSGLATQAKKIGVSAQNIANMGSSGVRSDPPAAGDDGYVPQRVVAVAAAEGGGVRGYNQPVKPASVQHYDPEDPTADEEGLVSRPNVSLEGEMVTQMQAKQAYEANLKVLQTVDEMAGALLDIDT